MNDWILNHSRSETLNAYECLKPESPVPGGAGELDRIQRSSGGQEAFMAAQWRQKKRGWEGLWQNSSSRIEGSCMTSYQWGEEFVLRTKFMKKEQKSS